MTYMQDLCQYKFRIVHSPVKPKIKAHDTGYACVKHPIGFVGGMISSAGRLDACRRLLGALRRNLSNESCQIILPQSLAIEMASQFLDSVIVDIVFVAHQFVNSAIRRQFNDAVGNSVDKLMVVAGEEDVSLVELQIIVECLDAFHIQVVGRRVKNQAISIAELHSCNHTAHLFSSRQDVHLFENVFILEKHTSQESLEIHLVAFAVLAEPVEHIIIGVEKSVLSSGR